MQHSNDEHKPKKTKKSGELPINNPPLYEPGVNDDLENPNGTQTGNPKAR